MKRTKRITERCLGWTTVLKFERLVPPHPNPFPWGEGKGCRQTGRVLSKPILVLTLLAWLDCSLTWQVAGQPGTAERIAKVELPGYKTVKLENGLTLFLLERHQLPLVSFHWLLKSGGSICDPDGREGLASLTANLLRKGTTTRTADQFSEALDFVGASFHAGARRGPFGPFQHGRKVSQACRVHPRSIAASRAAFTWLKVPPGAVPGCGEGGRVGPPRSRRPRLRIGPGTTVPVCYMRASFPPPGS